MSIREFLEWIEMERPTPKHEQYSSTSFRPRLNIKEKSWIWVSLSPCFLTVEATATCFRFHDRLCSRAMRQNEAFRSYFVIYPVIAARQADHHPPWRNMIECHNQVQLHGDHILVCVDKVEAKVIVEWGKPWSQEGQRTMDPVWGWQGWETGEQAGPSYMGSRARLQCAPHQWSLPMWLWLDFLLISSHLICSDDVDYSHLISSWNLCGWREGLLCLWKNMVSIFKYIEVKEKSHMLIFLIWSLFHEPFWLEKPSYISNRSWIMLGSVFLDDASLLPPTNYRRQTPTQTVHFKIQLWT